MLISFVRSFRNVRSVLHLRKVFRARKSSTCALASLVVPSIPLPKGVHARLTTLMDIRISRLPFNLGSNVRCRAAILSQIVVPGEGLRPPSKRTLAVQRRHSQLFVTLESEPTSHLLNDHEWHELRSHSLCFRQSWRTSRPLNKEAESLVAPPLPGPSL